MHPFRSSRRRAALVSVLAALGLLAVYLGFDSASPRGPAWLDSLAAWTGLSQSLPAGGSDSSASQDPHPSFASPVLSLSPLAAPPAFATPNLPFDLLSLEGQGGQGIHRAVRRAGVWFPVFSPGQLGDAADPDAADSADIPLYITSATPPATPPGQTLSYPFEAIGGTPPYRWRMVLGVEGFSIDPESGLLSGQFPEPGAFPLAIHVTDAAGAQDSALYTLRINDDSPLAITSDSLPDGTLGIPYETTLTASGGTPPYSWSTDLSLPDGFSLDPGSGLLSGLASSSGFEQDITFRVTDAARREISATLSLRILASFEITTPAQLSPAAPGAPYQLAFATSGGTPPLTWRLVEGDLPLAPSGSPWSLSPEGVLSGEAPQFDSLHRFTLEALDASGSSSRKSFFLPVRRSLIVVPSREKAGLAWKPREIASLIGSPVRTFSVTRSLSPDGAAARPVYQGGGTNFVDQGLATGATYFYTLHAHPPSGTAVPVATTAVRILPFTSGRGTPGRFADPHADAVKLFRPLSSGGHGSAFLPGNVTGPPDGRGTFTPASDPSHVLSLHARPGSPGSSLDAFGGSVILAFEDNIIHITPGEDFTVFENVFFIGGDPNQRFMEPAIVSVALFEDEWHRLPVDVVPPATTSSTPPTLDPFYYNRGFAGRNATTGADPADPRQSGGDSFDLSALRIPGLTWVRYIKLQSAGHNVLRDDFGGHAVQHPTILGAASGTGSSGFDLDAVTAIHH